MQLLAGTDAGTGVRGHVRLWGEFCCSTPQYGRGHGGGDEGHTQEHTQERTRKCCTYPLATYPLKSARIMLGCPGGCSKSLCNKKKKFVLILRPLPKASFEALFFRNTIGDKIWKKGRDPHPQDKIQHLDFTKDPRPLYYKTPPCGFYHKNVCSKAVFGP